MSLDAQNEQAGQPRLVADGPFKGWLSWSGGEDPYESVIGPFCFRVDDGKVRCAFLPTRDHLNGGGSIHGGALMSFADFSLFAIARAALGDEKAVTLSFNAEFVTAGVAGAPVEATGEVLRATRSVVFVRGVVTQGSRPLLAFSGTLKKIKAPAESGG